LIRLKQKKILLIYTILLLPFFAYFIRPDLLGADGYAFFNYVCKGLSLDAPQTALLFFSEMPCSFFAAKLFLFGQITTALFAIYLIARLFDKQNAWKAPALALGLMNILLFDFMKFEDDQLAYPLLFFALYFFLRGKKEKTQKRRAFLWQLGAIALTLLTATIWKGSLLYLLAFGLTFWPATILAYLVIGWLVPGALGAFLPNTIVQENKPLVGWLSLKFGLLGYLRQLPVFSIELLFFSAVAIINSKFTLHAVPLLAVGLMLFWQKLHTPFKIVLIAFAIGTLAWNTYFVFASEPTTETWQAIHYALNVAPNKMIANNDFGAGYWIEYAGGTPSAKGGWNEQADFNGITLARKIKGWQDPRLSDCETLKETREWLVLNC
jgi:hypothetical protein